MSVATILAGYNPWVNVGQLLSSESALLIMIAVGILVSIIGALYWDLQVRLGNSTAALGGIIAVAVGLILCLGGVLLAIFKPQPGTKASAGGQT